MYSRPDREAQSEREEDKADAGSPGIGVDALALEHSEADQNDREDDDQHPDPQLAGPRDMALLHGEGRHEPVQPKRCPRDAEDKLDRLHETQVYPVCGGA